MVIFWLYDRTLERDKMREKKIRSTGEFVVLASGSEHSERAQKQWIDNNSLGAWGSVTSR